MLVVVAEHERADAQRVGDGGDVRERDGRREVVVDEVVGHEERRVAERLGLARLLGELLARAALGRDDTEAELRSCITGRDPIRSPRQPVEPQPPRPRSVSSRSSTSSHSTVSKRWITSCAMRSPRLHLERLGRIEVDEQHADLVAVAGVDEAGRVEAR